MNNDCGICYDDYDFDKQIPCIGTCGHTICDRCRISMRSSRCPLCNRKEAFAVKHVNKQLWDLIQFASFISGKTETKREDISETTERCSKCKQPSKKLRICYECCINSGVIKKCLKEDEVAENVEEICQKIRNRALCGDCVIDGEHFKHNTVYLDNFIDSYVSFLENKQ